MPTLVTIHHPRTVKLVRRNTPKDVVSLCTFHRFPSQRDVTAIFVTARVKCLHLSRRLTFAQTENTDGRNGKVRCGNMDVFVTYITYPGRDFQFHIIVRSVFETVATVDKTYPVDAIYGTFDSVTVAQIGITTIHITLIIVVIHLNSVYSGRCLKVYLHPLCFIVGRSQPISLAILVRQSGSSMTFYSRRTSGRLVVRKKHPAAELTLLSRHSRCITGIISKTGVTIHDAVFVKISREHAETAFPVHINGQSHRTEMPILPTWSEHRTSMTGTVDITARLIGNGVMFLIGIRSHRMVGHIYTIGIYIELSARSGILHVIPPVVLCQPRSFDIAAQHGIGMIFSKTFPTMFLWVEIEKFQLLAFLYETMVLVELHAANGPLVGRAPEHVSTAVIIKKKVRVLQVGDDGRSGFPVTRLGVVGIKHTHHTRRIATDIKY